VSPLWLVLLLAAPEPRRYSQLSIKDMEAMAPVLKSYVVEVTVELAQDGPMIDVVERTGYGIAWGKDRVAVLAPVVDGAKKIRVLGPKRIPLEAELLLYDPNRRVAILGTKRPLADTGLVKPRIAPKRRKEDDEVFALIATSAESGVVFGVITDTGEQPEYEGHPRVDLKLERGMPVFDERARFVGYSRVVAFDQDRYMLITPEQILSAQTATSAASLPKPPDPSKKPWWSK
jgi:hypothetical protein